jgi:hypothetical protein
MSSKGEMKTSLRLMIWREQGIGRGFKWRNLCTDVFMLDVLEEFELAVGAFGEDRRAEGFHDLLDGDGCACELVFCGTGCYMGIDGWEKGRCRGRRTIRGQMRLQDGSMTGSAGWNGVEGWRTHADGLKIDISGGDLWGSGSKGEEGTEWIEDGIDLEGSTEDAEFDKGHGYDVGGERE